jgi:hypothetical protein
MRKTGHTSNGQGSLLIERQICGVNIRRASGTKSPDELAEILALLAALGKNGRSDLVAAVAAGHYRGVDLLRLSQEGKPLPGPTDRVTGPVPLATAIRAERLGMLLSDAVEGMLAKKKGRPSHLKEMRRQLLAMASRHPKNTVADLVGVLIREREAFDRAGHHAAFTRLRANSMVLAHWADGKSRGATWHEVKMGIEATHVKPADRRRHAPLTPWELKGYRDLLNEARPGNGEILVALCVTGMRPSEYWAKDCWSVHADYIFVKGKKTRAAERRVPVVAEIVTPDISFQLWGRAFRALLMDVSKWSRSAFPGQPLPHTPYDCRRSFAHWCDFAGVPRGRSAHYLGHSPATITDHYAFTKPTDEELRSDAAVLREYLVSSVAATKAAIEAEGSRVRRPQRIAHKRLDL